MLSLGMDQEHLIFLSYASPDRDEVLSYYEHLISCGYDVWLDKNKLVGGQNWDLEIKRALQKAEIIVVFLSNNSVDRRGYAQREIKIALDQRNNRLVDDIYLIPVVIEDDVQIPSELSDIQVIGVSDENRFDALCNAIEHQLKTIGARSEKAQIISNVRWSFTDASESLEALPGYDIRYRLIQLRSKEYPRIGEITDIIKGEFLQSFADCRKILFCQDNEIHNFGQDRFRRQDVWEAACNDPSFRGRMISVKADIYWHGSGAAHGNMNFQTYNFSLNPQVRIQELSDIFDKQEEALEVIKRQSRKQLSFDLFGEEKFENEVSKFDHEWIDSGTSDWEDFTNFIFSEESIDVFFPPYQVAPYAAGAQLVSIEYEQIAPFLRREIALLLDIDHLRDRNLQIEKLDGNVSLTDQA